MFSMFIFMRSVTVRAEQIIMTLEHVTLSNSIYVLAKILGVACCHNTYVGVVAIVAIVT